MVKLTVSEIYISGEKGRGRKEEMERRRDRGQTKKEVRRWLSATEPWGFASALVVRVMMTMITSFKVRLNKKFGIHFGEWKEAAIIANHAARQAKNGASGLADHVLGELILIKMG